VTRALGVHVVRRDEDGRDREGDAGGRRELSRARSIFRPWRRLSGFLC